VENTSDAMTDDVNFTRSGKRPEPIETGNRQLGPRAYVYVIRLSKTAGSQPIRGTETAE